MTFARSASLLSSVGVILLAHAAAPVTRPPELPVAVDGAAVAIRGAAPGRAASLSFSAHAHDRIVIAISALKMEPASGSALLIGVRDAQDRPVTSEPARCFTAGTLDAGDTCTAIVEILSGGRHILELEPPFSAAASYSVKLSTQRIATLGIGAPAIEFATTKPMETIEFELDVPAGRSVMIAVDGLKHTPDIDSNSQLGVWAADGNRIAGYGCRTRPIEGLAVPPGPCRTKVPAPASDTHYQVRFKGPAGATASGYLTAAEVKP